MEATDIEVGFEDSPVSFKNPQVIEKEMDKTQMQMMMDMMKSMMEEMKEMKAENKEMNGELKQELLEIKQVLKEMNNESKARLEEWKGDRKKEIREEVKIKIEQEVDIPKEVKDSDDELKQGIVETDVVDIKIGIECVQIDSVIGKLENPGCYHLKKESDLEEFVEESQDRKIKVIIRVRRKSKRKKKIKKKVRRYSKRYDFKSKIEALYREILFSRRKNTKYKLFSDTSVSIGSYKAASIKEILSFIKEKCVSFYELENKTERERDKNNCKQDKAKRGKANYVKEVVRKEKEPPDRV